MRISDWSSDVCSSDLRNGEDLLEQADLSFLYPINPSWSLVGRYYYSIQDKQMLEGIAGVQWDSCCLAARLVARRYVRNRTGEMNDAIRLRSEEHTSELQSLMRISYAVFCLKKKQIRLFSTYIRLTNIYTHRDKPNHNYSIL